MAALVTRECWDSMLERPAITTVRSDSGVRPMWLPSRPKATHPQVDESPKNRAFLAGDRASAGPYS